MAKEVIGFLRGQLSIFRHRFRIIDYHPTPQIIIDSRLRGNDIKDNVTLVKDSVTPAKAGVQEEDS